MSQVEVTVEGGQVHVNLDKLKMGKQKNATIKWKLKTGGWTFPRDGIVIHDPDEQFSNYQVGEQGTSFSVVDANTNSKEYKYDVKVTDGKQVIVLDPTIENEGP